MMRVCGFSLRRTSSLMFCSPSFASERGGRGERAAHEAIPHLENTVLAHKTAPTGLFALPHSILEITENTVLDGVPKIPTSGNTVRYA